MDEHFALFLQEFGEPTCNQTVPAASLATYNGVLPDCLLSYWRAYGWASFSRGLIWLTDPDAFSGLVADWLSHVTNLQGSEYVVFARSAFGNLFAYRPSTGSVIRISSSNGWIMASKKHDIPAKNKELSIQSFFATACKSDFDVEDDEESPLHDHLIDKLGPLQSDEVYAFSSSLVPQLQHASKQSLHTFLCSISRAGTPVLRLV